MNRSVIGILVAMFWGAALAETVPEPSAYRSAPYRAPVPATLQGATVVDAVEAHRLWREGEVAFIDVLPRPPKPENLPEDTVWREKPRHSIPGAIWLPNVGYDMLAVEMQDYFRAGLRQVTDGDTTHPVLLFCLAECWMSWNAAKRAVSWGYTQVYWLPTGTDGWTWEGYPTEIIPPVPGDK